MHVIHIVATNIRRGGGERLLQYIVRYLSEKRKDLICNLYINNSLSIECSNNVVIHRHVSAVSKYKVYFNSLSSVLYFGNLPPLRPSQKSILYLHNAYLTTDNSENLKFSIYLFAKFAVLKIYLKCFVRNVSTIGCQTPSMDARIRRAYGKNLNVRIYPVFERFFAKNITKRYDICYVSMATEHKNHVRFFDALGILANRGVSVSALVTVRAAKEKLVEQIKQVNAVGPVKIHNVGEVPTSNVVELYQESRCLVFPSLEESFGLPLIEAAGVGLPVLASDLPYVYEVIQPTMVFDPLSSSSIADCIERFISCGYKVKPAELNVTNSIEKLIEDLV